MIVDNTDSSSDAYIALKDHVEYCSAIYVQSVAGQLIEAARYLDRTVQSNSDRGSQCFTLFFDREKLGKCVVQMGIKSPGGINLNWSDVRYLAATDTEANKLVSIVLAERLLTQVSTHGVIWITRSGQALNEAA